MAKALVIFHNSTGGGGTSLQKLSYSVVFRGADVSEEIATGPQIDFDIDLPHDFVISTLGRAIVQVVQAKAVALGLVAQASSIRFPSYDTGSAFYRSGIYMLPWEWFRLKLR